MLVMRRTTLQLHISLLGPLLVALGWRLLLWGNLPRSGMISDEAEYLAAADWLALGRGFAWHQGWFWTRAPLYPLFLAGHLRLFGLALTPIFVSQTVLSLLNVALVYLLGLQLGGGSTARRRMATLAALLAALYLPFAAYAQLLLGETFYLSLLLGGFAALGGWAQRVGERNARFFLLLGAALFALATLTRGLTLAFLPLAAVWVWRTAYVQLAFRAAELRAEKFAATKHQGGQEAKGRSLPTGSSAPTDVAGVFAQPVAATGARLRRALLPALGFALAALLLVLPWTIYASRTYGGFVVVDTTGAFNLLLGARTAYDGTREDAATRRFVLALLDARLDRAAREALLRDELDSTGRVLRAGSCLYRAGDEHVRAALARAPTAISQGVRQQLMSAEAFCLLRAAPLAFARKSLVELVDFFQINYSGAERLSNGFALGALPSWYALALFLLDDTIYVLALPLAVLGWALLRQDEHSGHPFDFAQGRRLAASGQHQASLIGLWLLYNLASAPLLFAINRFRLPLMPFVLLLAAVVLAHFPFTKGLLGQQFRRGARRASPRPPADESGRNPAPLAPTAHPRTSRPLADERAIDLPIATQRSVWAALRTRYGLACVTLATLLGLIAATPYAYLEPRPAGADSRWASYLGDYPSSLTSTLLALRTRPAFRNEQALSAALARRDADAARALLADPVTASYSRAIARPLLAGIEGRPTEGLATLERQPEQPLAPWQTALVRGELLRQRGDWAEARRALSPTLVDDQNPVAWAWRWLAPPPLPNGRIALADDLDLGYIDGFYLGEYDPTLGATIRWSGPGARLRFPAAARASAQQLCLAASAGGWPTDLPLPTLELRLDGATFAALPLTRKLREQCVALPARPAGSDLVIELHSARFVPAAADLINQQGPLAGQLRLLGVQVDWAAVR